MSLRDKLRMKRRTKQLFKSFLLVMFCMLVGGAAGVWTFKKIEWLTTIPSLAEIKAMDNVSSYLSFGTQDTVHKSRASTVKVVSLAPEQQLFSVATGTYFTYNGRYFVLTVNHGVTGECQYTKINVDGKFFRCMEFIELNYISDYAIIEVNEILTREAIDILTTIPTGSEWKDALAILSPVYFTGYPNNVGPLSLSGEIIGYAPDGLIYIRSYAWAGSSGSAIFTPDGKIIGYVLAVDIGNSEFGEDVQENILIVAPSYQIDLGVID